MKKKQTKRTPAAILAKSKGAAAKPTRAKAAASLATPPPAALAEMEAARENVENNPAIQRLFECIFEECGKPSEPTADEMKMARADCDGALKSGTEGMFPSYTRHDAGEAEKTVARAEIVRMLTGWIRGDVPPPDGATRADAALRGIAWEGWEWNLRGVDVSRPAVDTIDEADRHAECFRRVEKEAAEVLVWKVANGEPARDNPVTPAREAAERYLEALFDEDEAWCELDAAEKTARATLPAAELAAAKARLDGHAVASPPSPPAAPANSAAVSLCDAESAGGRSLRVLREEAVKDWWKDVGGWDSERMPKGKGSPARRLDAFRVWVDKKWQAGTDANRERRGIPGKDFAVLCERFRKTPPA